MPGRRTAFKGCILSTCLFKKKKDEKKEACISVCAREKSRNVIIFTLIWLYRIELSLW